MCSCSCLYYRQASIIQESMMFYFLYWLYHVITGKPIWYRKYTIANHTIHVHDTRADMQRFRYKTHVHESNSPRTFHILRNTEAFSGCYTTSCRRCPFSSSVPTNKSYICSANFVAIISRPIYKKEPRC